jgi:hypothetical protein
LKKITGGWVNSSIGNVEPVKKMFSHRDDVTLAGPQSTAHSGAVRVARWWKQVAETLDRAILNLRDGELTALRTWRSM